MSTLPIEQKALILDSKQGNFVLGTEKVHRPGPGQLLLKIKATSLNPVDWKIQKYGAFITDFPAILGTDMSGEVAAVGEGVTKFKVGDSVFCQGRFANDYATFQQYALADEHHLAKVPPNITPEEAATIPVAFTAAFVAMYNANPHGIGLADPVNPSGRGHYKDEPFVVLGGASSVGQYAIQLAKLSGFSPIITSASVKHTEFLQSLGATHVLDRHLPNDSMKAAVKGITNKSVKYVYDAISSKETQNAANEILASGGSLVTVLEPTVTPTDKYVNHVLGVRQLDHNVELMKGAYSKLTEWVENGTIKPNKVDVLQNGLAGIVGGLKRMEEDKVSGVKLVARPEETPE